MKLFKIIFVISMVFINTVLVSNLYGSHEVIRKSAEINKKNNRHFVPYIGVNVRLGTQSLISGAGFYYNSPMAWVLFEWMQGIKKPVYFYSQFRIGMPMSYVDSPFALFMPMINMEALKFGFLIGIGVNIFDARYNDKGWLIRINSGLTVDFGVYNHNIIDGMPFSGEFIVQRMLNIGFESNIRISYHYNKYTALSFGFDIGYTSGVYSGDPFYSNEQRITTASHMMIFGFVFGINF